MAVLRVLLAAAVGALAILILAYFVTGQRRFLGWALRLFVTVLLIAFAFFTVLIFDRFFGG